MFFLRTQGPGHPHASGGPYTKPGPQPNCPQLTPAQRAPVGVHSHVVLLQFSFQTAPTEYVFPPRWHTTVSSPGKEKPVQEAAEA